MVSEGFFGCTRHIQKQWVVSHIIIWQYSVAVELLSVLLGAWIISRRLLDIYFGILIEYLFRLKFHTFPTSEFTLNAKLYIRWWKQALRTREV